MTAEQQAELAPDRIPISVMMECKQRQSGRWSFPAWNAIGVVVAGAQATDEPLQCTQVRDEDGVQQFLWTGLVLELFKDGCESYWYNLVSEKPSLFVVCRDDEDKGGLMPALVSANPDEAGAHEEGDDTVFDVAMPPEVYRWLERFVVEHYKPAERKKRKRQNWTEDSK